VYGEEVYNSSFTAHSSVIDINDKPNGVYFMKLKTEQGIGIQKIIKE